jgi:hypothetical protein
MADSAADLEAHNGSSSATQTAKDLFSGAAGGIAQVLIGTFPSLALEPFLPTSSGN